MNRQFFGVTAVLLSVTITHTIRAQAPGYPAPNGYPTQPAVYLAAPQGPSGVYPAGGAMPPQGRVQLADCQSCVGGAGAYPSPMYAAGYGDGTDAMGNGSGGCTADGYGVGDWGAGGCGPGGCGGQLAALGDHLAGGYDGYNSQCCGQADGPFGSGGCCQPRWFDAHAEWLYWQRDYSDSLALSSTGILGPPALDANQLDLNHESGFRVTGTYVLGPSAGLEATYFGGFNWASGAQATGNGTLYSVFSDFGSLPLNGFPETDAAFLHQVALSSELDNVELNVRRRWVSANCIVHSSVLVGARYLRLRDDLIYATDTGQNSMVYSVKTDNDLVGAQLGGDMFLCITPRFKIGGEVEAGVYGNGSKQRTHMTSTASPELREDLRSTDVAFVGEAGLMALYRVSSHLTLRGGYQVLFVDGVATGVDNFNTESPFAARSSFLNNNGDVVYHGSSLGFECTW